MSVLPEIAYERPQSLQKTLELLNRYKDKAAPLAGGTDLVVSMKYRAMLQLVDGVGTPEAKWPAAQRVPPRRRPEMVISLTDLHELKGINRNEDTLWLGPSTTMTAIAESWDFPTGLRALQDAAAVMGSPLVRNRATIGGNLITARPAADPSVAFLALGGGLELASLQGKRWVEAASFFIGPGSTVRQSEELLTGLRCPWGPGEGSAYLRQGTRRQLEIALAGVASWVRIDPETGLITAARIVLGAVGPTPILSSGAASLLIDRKPTAEVIAEAAEAAREEARPIDDFRGSAAYRREIIAVLTRRTLEKATSLTTGERIPS